MKNKLHILFISLSIIIFCDSIDVYAQENLIPSPRSAEWKKGSLNLAKGVLLEKNKPDLAKEYQLAEEIFREWHVELKTNKSNKNLPVLKLELTNTGATGKPKGSYRLKIEGKSIVIAADSEIGIFYGLQTLRQFSAQNKKLSFCEISDDPAFSWRAFLVDVGRNYQPLEMLKEQIDVMARYKMNVLHFHFTEDVAWRLVSKKYPGLAEASNMTRWKGNYYTEAEFRELMKYCKDRHITLLPEIDMPGHSAAFERFFKVNMQSDSGIVYIKELLKEFSETYKGLPYLHIGGDEVKISNKNFMTEITRYVERLGYETIGWQPGSNLMPQTKRQLWMGGPEVIKEAGESVFIDSKHLYINHMDPMETVVTLFHRKIGEQDKEHKNLIGATLCSWPDRAVNKPIDMFYQNAVYPSLITFAERIWNGGGKAGWTANITASNTKDYADFKDFEARLLYHKNKYFKGMPFPYVKQTGLKWDLIGPFENDGDLAKSFPIEKNGASEQWKVAKTAEGGTIILRHWWADIIKGAIDEPKPNTTWYARTKIWSNTAGVKPFWIGFNNLSRSYASDSPKLNTWDDLNSEVRVNADLIAAPVWKQAGVKGELELPLIDEGYSFREPTLINLKQGWNDVLIKLPVGSFKGKDWQNPVKWMFTFIPLDETEE